MVQATFKIVQPAMVRQKFYPDFLETNIKNFKDKNAEYPMTKDDDNAVEFLKIVNEKKLKIVNEIKNIYRVKKGSKLFLVYSNNMRAIDDDGNVIDQYYHLYGYELHPKIKNNPKTGKLEPDGIKIEHKIPFTPKEVEKVIKMCDEEFRENIWFLYCEVAQDGSQIVNQSRTQLIRTEDVFKNASPKEIKKIIEKRANEIESLTELETFIPPSPSTLKT